MKSYILICLVALLIACTGCNDSGTVGLPQPEPPVVFDWNNSEYDWGVTLDEDCAARGYKFGSFSPRSAIRVFGVTATHLFLTRIPSPHGKGLEQYDLQTGETKMVWPYSFDYAQVSPDGSCIAFRRNLRTISFLRLATGESWSFTASSDSIDSFGGSGMDVRWLPDNHSILVYFLLNDKRKVSFLLPITPPHILIPYSEREVLYTYFTDTFDVFFNHEIRGVKTYLEVRHIGDTALVASTRMPKGLYEMGVYNGGCVSPDGKWLVAPVRANLSMTRLSHLYLMDGIGVFDLRNGSATQYQLYRFIGDHTLFHRNCLYSYEIGYSMSAVWSHDNKSLYYEQLRMSDSTMQVVRYDIDAETTQEITNFTW